MSCTRMRILSSARCTKPSRIFATPSSSPMVRTFFCVSRYSLTEVREMTWSESRRASKVSKSSCMPSARNEGVSPLMALAVNGSTATDLPRAALPPEGRSSPMSMKCSVNEAASATASTLTTAKLSFRCAGAACCWSTSRSRLMPSGVHSNAQASTTVSGNPSIASSVIACSGHSGALKVGSTTEHISTTSHATTP